MTEPAQPVQPDQLAPPLALRGFLPVWDIERRHVDPGPIIAWTLAHIRGLGYPVESLDTAHHHIDPGQALAVTQSLSKASLATELRGHVRRVVLEAIPEIPVERVWVQTRTHFRVLVPGDTVSPVPPHTDFGFGHALDERNLWLSLSDVEGLAALHLLPLAKSLSWMARTGKVHGVLEDVPDLEPHATCAGDVLLFTPLHVHRAWPPSGDHCRVSLDVRIVPRPTSRYDFTFSPLSPYSSAREEA